MVVVTTGGGFEWNDITPLLAAAMVDPSESLSANPQALDQLVAALKAIRQPSTPQAIDPLPETASSISGKTYAFELSPLDLKTIRWEFNDSAEAKLFVTFYNQPELELLIGLDGVYRIYPIGEHGLAMGLRGKWIDAQTFLFDYDTIANHDAYTLELHFNGDKVTIHAKERTQEAVLIIEGRVQE
jgi:hypothetical protein